MKISAEEFARYSSGESSPEEREKIEQWLRQPEEELPSSDGEQQRLEVIWKRLSAAHRQPKRPGRRYFLGGMAASLFLGALLVLYTLSKKSASALAYKTIQVPYGKKLKLVLPDSSIIQLNSGSSFHYPLQFGPAGRLVRLEGEGFFIISKDPKRPFTVETPHSTTRVLGTRFNLREFREDRSSSLVVAEGKVRFVGKDCRDTLYLSADEQGIFQGKQMQKNTVTASAYSSWKDKTLRFMNIPLAEAIPLIERWYNVKIRVADPSLSMLHIKGSFTNQQLHKVLDDVAYLLNLEYRQKNREVVFYSK